MIYVQDSDFTLHVGDVRLAAKRLSQLSLLAEAGP